MLLSLCAAAVAFVANERPGDPVCSHATCLPVFYPGLNGSKCYRIPSIVQTHKGTLLAFAENRLGDCGDGGRHNLVLRRSLDGGASWGPLITAVVGSTPCPGCPAAVSNPNPVEVNFPNGTRAVLLAFDTLNNPSAAHHGLDRTVWSLDDGLTWGNASTLAFPPVQNAGALIGPATGLQAADGTLFFWLVEGSALIFSRDHGSARRTLQPRRARARARMRLLLLPPTAETWAASSKAAMHSECSIAFAADAANSTLIMNCRTKSHHRAQIYWRPDGHGGYQVWATHQPPACTASLPPCPTAQLPRLCWRPVPRQPSKPTYPDGLIDANCQGSIINVGGGATSSQGTARPFPAPPSRPPAKTGRGAADAGACSSLHEQRGPPQRSRTHDHSP